MNELIRFQKEANETTEEEEKHNWKEKNLEIEKTTGKMMKMKKKPQRRQRKERKEKKGSPNRDPEKKEDMKEKEKKGKESITFAACSCLNLLFIESQEVAVWCCVQSEKEVNLRDSPLPQS